jgi:hypothetical protein
MRRFTLPNLLLLLAVGHALALWGWGVWRHPWWTCAVTAAVCWVLYLWMEWGNAQGGQG